MIFSSRSMHICFKLKLFFMQMQFLSGEFFSRPRIFWPVLLLFCRVLCAPAEGGATNEVDALRQELRQMRQKHQEEIDRLEKRIVELEKSGADRMHLSDEGIEALDDMQRAKEKGEVETYYDRTALEAYRETLPESARKLEDNTSGKLFDYLTKGFEWHSYFRAGYGVNSKGGHMEAFQAPGAPAKYRLGNEQESYFEANFIEKNWNPNDKGPTIRTEFLPAFQTQSGKTWDEENKLVMRQMFASMGNFLESNPSAKVWAGERFYRLPELNLNDFWWYDMSGYGGGLEDIDLGGGRLHIAYIGYSEAASSFWNSNNKNAYNYITQNGRLAKNNLNIRFSDLSAGADKLSAWVNGGYMQGGTTTNTSGASWDYPSQFGIDCGVMHQLKYKNMANQAALQYGYGCNSSLAAGGNNPPDSDNSHACIFRATDMYTHQYTRRFCIEVDGAAQYSHNGADSGADQTWLSMGMRPIYHFHKYIGIELEPGIDYVNNRQYDLSSYLLKITAALRIAPAAAQDSRPEFRLFCTYAQWGQDFEGNPAMGGTAFLDRRNGVNMGVQVEHWF